MRYASYKTRNVRYCASLTFDSRKIQVNYDSPRELVKSLRAMSASSAGVIVHKVYQKGEGVNG
jgi:hypothetical protein